MRNKKFDFDKFEQILYSICATAVTAVLVSVAILVAGGGFYVLLRMDHNHNTLIKERRYITQYAIHGRQTRACKTHSSDNS